MARYGGGDEKNSRSELRRGESGSKAAALQKKSRLEAGATKYDGGCEDERSAKNQRKSRSPTAIRDNAYAPLTAGKRDWVRDDKAPTHLKENSPHWILPVSAVSSSCNTA